MSKIFALSLTIAFWTASAEATFCPWLTGSQPEITRFEGSEYETHWIGSGGKPVQAIRGPALLSQEEAQILAYRVEELGQDNLNNPDNVKPNVVKIPSFEIKTGERIGPNGYFESQLNPIELSIFNKLQKNISQRLHHGILALQEFASIDPDSTNNMIQHPDKSKASSSINLNDLESGKAKLQVAYMELHYYPPMDHKQTGYDVWHVDSGMTFTHTFWGRSTDIKGKKLSYKHKSDSSYFFGHNTYHRSPKVIPNEGRFAVLVFLEYVNI